MKPLIASIAFLILGISTHAQQLDCKDEILSPKETSFREVSIDEIAFKLPKCISLERKEGIERWGWIFEDTDIQVQVFVGPEHPKDSGFERSLKSYVMKQEVIDGINADISRYDNPEAKLRYVSTIRLPTKSPGFRGYTIVFRSSEPGLHNFAEKVFQSIRLRSPKSVKRNASPPSNTAFARITTASLQKN